MIRKIRNLFKSKTIFLDKDNKEIQYKEYLEKEDTIIIETDTGLEKISVSGLGIK